MSRHWKLPSGCAALGALLSLAPAAWGAVSIGEVHATNLGTTTATLAWTTSEVSTPGLDLFSDAAGSVPVASPLGLEYFPLAEGDLGVSNDPAVRSARRALQALVRDRRAVVVRVTGLSPGTTYHVRARSFDAGGADNAAAPAPLRAFTTAQVTGMVSDARLLRVRFPGFEAEGMVALLQGPAGTTPLSSVVGDGTAQDSALFALANILDSSTGTNAAFSSTRNFTVRVLGAGAPSGEASADIAFTGDFNVARYELVETSFTTPAPFITSHPKDLTVTAGQPASFSVAASGTPAPAFQWRKNSVPIIGATLSSYAIPAAAESDAGDYDVVATNSAGSALSTIARLTVNPAPAAPAFSRQPADAWAEPGQTVLFSVSATGSQPIAHRWQRQPAGAPGFADLSDGPGLSGSATPDLSVSQVLAAMNGDRFRCVATNALGSETSTAATLNVLVLIDPPTITAQPLSQTVEAGQTALFSVSATGTGTLSYQWKKNGLPIGGATGSTLSIPNAQTADNGSYQVVVSASGKSTDSQQALLSVSPAGFSATHSLPAGGYLPGGTVQIAVSIAHAGTPTRLQLDAVIPAGWTLASDTSTAQTRPAAGAAGTLSWIYQAPVPDSPVNFTYTLAVPADHTGQKSVSATLTAGFASLPDASFLLRPEPLTIPHGTYHSADTTPADWAIGIPELVRVIQLYNTRFGTTRTGCYLVRDTTADGFDPDPANDGSTPATLSRHHSADYDRDGKLGIPELLRVIQLYNYRSGSTRTGEYHRERQGDPTGPDGFAPGP